MRPMMSQPSCTCRLLRPLEFAEMRAQLVEQCNEFSVAITAMLFLYQIRLAAKKAKGVVMRQAWDFLHLRKDPRNDDLLCKCPFVQLLNP